MCIDSERKTNCNKVMKANELMVGDYLMHNGLPYRVIQVDGIVRDGWILENGEEDCGEPIPITADILKKNGWEERPTGYVFYTDGKKYDNSLWYIFCSNTFVVNSAEFQIKYVHELQHAMRLCGIKKEIEL